MFRTEYEGGPSPERLTFCKAKTKSFTLSLKKGEGKKKSRVQFFAPKQKQVGWNPTDKETRGKQNQ